MNTKQTAVTDSGKAPSFEAHERNAITDRLQAQFVKPYFSTHRNPIEGAPFNYFEIQTTREMQSPDGESRFIEPARCEEDCQDDHPLACGPVVFSIYGHLKGGTVEHICDRNTLAEARETLSNIGITLNP